MPELNAQANGSAANGASAHELNGATNPALFSNIEIDQSAAPTEDATTPSTGRNSQPGETPVVQQEPKTTSAADVRVADIRKNQQDCRGEKIDFVFYRRREFAIYRSGGKILVQYSDDETVAKAQVANTAELLPLRGRLQYLVKDMTAPNAYHWQIAEALRLGLDGQKDAAKSTLQGAIDHIIARRVSEGRTHYLTYAGGVVILAVATLCAAAAALWFIWHTTPDQIASGLNYLMMATGSGAMGAMLSTAIALRARTVATDVDLKSNAVDSAVRIMIGVISAAALYLILDSNLLDDVKVGATTLKPDLNWKLALLVGFAAGFLERLLPDLLEKKLAPALAK